MDPLITDVVIVETTVWIDYFRNVESPQTDWVDWAAGRLRIAILDLILCEVLQGITNEAEFLRAKDKLLKLEVCESGSMQLALASARNYRSLRSRGITIRGTIDCIIATYCIERGFFLLHNDRDFIPFEAHLGLRVVRPGVTRVH